MTLRDYAGDESASTSRRDPTGRFMARLGFAALAVLAAAAAPATPGQLILSGPADIVSRAGLSDDQIAGIFDQVARTSFDMPADWRAELRIRHGRIEGAPVLVVRGANLLCGATGGCETWIFRRQGARWINAIAGEAPVADAIALGPHRTNGRLDLVAGNRISASRSSYAVYAFDGRIYRRKTCFEAGVDRHGLASGKSEAVACR